MAVLKQLKISDWRAIRAEDLGRLGTTKTSCNWGAELGEVGNETGMLGKTPDGASFFGLNGYTAIWIQASLRNLEKFGLRSLRSSP